MDPAPPDVQPRMTIDAATAEGATHGQSSGTATTVYFGLFSGSQPNPNAPDGTLTGVHQVAGIPAWMVIVDGVVMGPVGGPGQRAVADAPAQTLRVIADADGTDLIGVLEGDIASEVPGISYVRAPK